MKLRAYPKKGQNAPFYHGNAHTQDYYWDRLLVFHFWKTASASSLLNLRV